MRDRILEAHERIRSIVRETPVEQSSLGAFLKLEHLQHTGSFKFRGASNKISALTPEQAARGVITASNGNHGLGVAAAAQSRGIAAGVYVSSRVSCAKRQRMEDHGAQVRLIGDNQLDAELAARHEAGKSGKVFISPYNDADVIAGQGTIGVELHRQLPEMDAVFVTVGGGGLIGGIGAYLKSVSPQTEIVGCWPENSPVLQQCIQAGRVIDVPERPTLSESTTGGLEPESITLELCKNVIDRYLLVSESEILSAMRLILETEHWLIEGASAVAVAAFLKESRGYKGKRAAIVLCGRNVSSEVLTRLQNVV